MDLRLVIGSELSEGEVVVVGLREDEPT